jgi:REP element-mobilizing transposase RayT
MTIARKQLISIEDTPYYHVVSRCVRRSFLCGIDKDSNKSFEHRRKWIVDRVKFLASVFNVQICSYAVMSNHYHLVLKVNDTKEWSIHQTLINWKSLCKLPLICQKFIDKESMCKAELEMVYLLNDKFRKRLMSISWFMKLLNQDIAFRANAEDNCKGHFWEARFKSQALLDERALLTCMAYVDLNPIRAAMTKTPETSDYTSIQERIQKKKMDLMPFGNDALPYLLADYLQLVDATGRAIIETKRGYIPKELPDILLRLNLNHDTWLDEFNSFKTLGITAVGTVAQLKNFCLSVGKKFNIGLKLKPALE